MNKYLKTYIRNRDIALKNTKIEKYELDYIDKGKIKTNHIHNLLYNNKESNILINKLLSSEIFINNLNSDSIYFLLKHSEEPERVINLLGDKGNEYIGKLKYNTMINLFLDSKEPKKIINILLNNNIFISNLDNDGIYKIFMYSDEPQKVLSILRKYRPDLNL